MLLSLGFLGLIIEIKTPTFGLAGAFGLASLAAFFGARYLVNLAGMEELMLLVLGVALLAAEVFVVPGVGLAGVGGTLALLASVTLSMIGSYPSMSEVISSLGLVAISILVLGVFAYALVRHLPYSRSLKGIILTESIGREGGYLAGQPQKERIGEAGIATTALRPSGTARFGEERLDVMTEGPFLDAGAAVKIVRVDGYRYVVRQAGSDDETARRA
jgi:membrane-bound serine protease (ClpP class)